MSLPPCPGRAAPSRHPGSRAARTAAAALGALLALAAWVIGQAGVAQAASPWPSGHGDQVRETVWISAPASGTLRPGMRGAPVRRLQQRLARLHYYPGAVNGQLGTDTLEAVWAFKEVQALPTTAGADDVDPAMQRALARPHLPPVLDPRGEDCASRSTCRAKCSSSTPATR
jgi:peptidoglycan hydrolase-like protein with peptidoglycan-binding domain